MPTYRNDGVVSYKVVNSDNVAETVIPGASVTVLRASAITDFTLTSALSSNTVTVSDAPGAEGTWTGSLSASLHGNDGDLLNISISGTWAGSVYLQRSHDAGVTWHDVGDPFTANAEKQIVDHDPNMIYRLGMKSGGYSSGSAVLLLSK